MIHRVIALGLALAAFGAIASCSSSSSPCDTAGCDSHATCTASTGVAVCSCNLGFVGSGRQCAACAPCAAGKFQSAACTSTGDTQCSPCTTCGTGQVQASACSAIADTQCSACATCPFGKFESAACNSTVDTTCSACTVCPADKFSATLCGGSTDATCSACSAGCMPGEFQSAACVSTSDRVCTPCSGACPMGQYLKTACTANADRTCKVPPSVPTKGLLVRWTLDDNKGTTAADASINKRDGILKNSSWVTNNCKLGACAHFTGTGGGNGSYLTYANTMPIGGSGASFAAWVALDKPGTGTFQTLFNGPYDSCCTTRFLIDGNLHAFWDAGMYSDQSLGSYTFPVNQWIHVVWTIAAGGNAILYVNGANVAQTAAGVPGTLTDLPDMDVGAADSFQWPLKGLLNDVLVYNRLLSANEITTLYQSY